ncbi:MAG: hypothetical protein A3H29_10910 [Acidobacteria bacterium RIFCSPLOWO2_02_FULL_67_21]|nr:MAG: hypothetical protein A3H29_10910 [Acidobacteria bacterium RIFCSPLOWO2_02_FULL_67_21]
MRRLARITLLAIAGLWLSPQPAGAQQWTPLTTTGGPPAARIHHALAYDAANDRLMLFGGSTYPGDFPALGDIWVLAHASGLTGAPAWQQLSPAGGPGTRTGADAVYDPDTNRLIVVGGAQAGESGLWNDVWVLTNASGLEASPPAWSQLLPTGSAPAARMNFDMVYDATSNRIVLFGGQAGGCGSVLNDAWILDFANGVGGTPHWIQLTTAGGPPVARRHAVSVYDAAANRMIVNGGQSSDCFGSLADTWALENANGTGGTPTWVPLSAMPSAQARTGSAAVLDPVSHTLMIFGGHTNTSPVNTVLAMSGTDAAAGTQTWTTVVPDGSVPGARTSHDAVYDPERAALITFGGDGAAGTTTWVLSFAVDDVPPELALPNIIEIEATSSAGAVVTYLAIALDDVDGPIAPVCSPASGATFPIGSTPVTCTATDSSGNEAEDGFDVIVEDRAPVLTIPDAVSAEATGAGGAVVTYSASAEDRVDGAVPIACTPASGSTFAIGTTAVTCTASDSRGTVASDGFVVTVEDTTPPVWTFASLMATVPTGSVPYAVAVNPVTKRIYVGNMSSNSVTVIDGVTGSVVTTIAVGAFPTVIAVNAVTNRIYTANYIGRSVSVIYGATNAVIATIGVSELARGVAVDPVTNRVYVSLRTDSQFVSSMRIIDGATNTVVAVTSNAGSYPLGIDVNPVTDRVYLANNLGNTVRVFDAATGAPVATVVVGSDPLHVSVDSTTNRIYVSNGGSNTVSVIDGATNAVVATVPVGVQPTGLRVDPLTHRLYVANTGSQTLSVIDTVTHTVLTTFATPGAATMVALDRSVNQVYVTTYNTNQVSLIQESATVTPLALNATSPAGATFEFGENANDIVSGLVPVACVPALGSVLPSAIRRPRARRVMLQAIVRASSSRRPSPASRRLSTSRTPREPMAGPPPWPRCSA